MLREAKRLWDMGWAVHWIKANSKAPVKAGWSGPVRDDWATVEREYREGYGLGVRLGESSKIGPSFLANIDVDIKSADKRHLAEALATLRRLLPGLDKAPLVQTGYGFRYFVRTTEPLASGKLSSSAETVVVHMPTSEVNKAQTRAVAEGRLTAAQLAAGYRIRTAWEIEFMSSGKQVVLPPSVHPDTGKPYLWVRPVAAENVPLIDPKGLPLGKGPGRPQGSRVVQGFTPVMVDLVGSPLSDRIVEMILTGGDVHDRSAACYSVALAMCRARFSDDEIMTVLTDRTTFLGETAYEHRSTASRAVAAAWVRDYCIQKARAETNAASAFEKEVEVTPLLGDADAVAQTVELVEAKDWRDRIARSGRNGEGPPKETLKNVVLILTHAVSPGVFRRDLFANRETYSCKTPWGGKKDAALTDDDAVKIKLWLSEKFHFEPSTGTIMDAMTAIATRNAFHPVRDELEALPPWDGVGRIDGWLKAHFNAKGPDEYLAQVFRKWLVAAVTRTYEPGTKFDWMPIFEGNQGTGKSSFGAILFGQEYFADWLPKLDDKDAALGLQGKRCVEFGELDQLRRNEVETIKAFVTRQVDNVRPPYGRKALEIYRQTVFFGSTNKDNYLKDDTGNRRFNPIEVGVLNFGALRRDRMQLWAEALFIYRNGLEASLYLDNGAEMFAKEIQNEKMVEDESAFMAKAISNFIKAEKQKPKDERFDFSRFNLLSLFEGLGPLQKWEGNARTIQFASKALKILGAKKIKSNGKKLWKV